MPRNKAYDAESEELIKDASDVPAELVRFAAFENVTDASETLVFARSLETVKNRVYAKKYAELKGRQLVPFSSEGGDASEYITFRTWDETAIAKIVVNYATDFPRVAQSATEYTIKYHDMGNSYGYSVQDLRSAAKAGVELSARQANGCRRGIDLGIDDAVALGVPQVKTFGLLNHPNVGLGTLPNGAWSTATGEEILEDLNDIITSMLVETLEIMAPNTILLTTAGFRLIATKLLNSAAGSMTVLEAFRAQNPGITVDSWTKLTNANAAGNNGRIVAYKKDPEVLEFEMGKEFEIFPGQMRGLEMEFYCKARFAGLAIHHPLAVSYFDDQLI